MRKASALILLTTLIASAWASTADAQVFVGKQRTINLEAEDLAALVGSARDPKAMSNRIFAMSVADILRKVAKHGGSPEIDESTMYISAAGDKMSIVTSSMGGKQSNVIRFDQKKMINIMWASKTYMEITFAEMKQMGAQANQALADMQKMMKDLPPEAQAYMKSKFDQTPKKKKPKRVTKTGKRGTFHGFPCQEYLIEGRSGGTTEREQVWVSRKFPAMRRAMDKMMSVIPQMKEGGIGDEMDVWKQIPDGWPVVSKEFTYDPMMRGTSLQIDEFTSMDRRASAPVNWGPPKGFTRMTKEDMFRGKGRGKRY